MNTKLWIVSVVYLFFIAIPTAVLLGIIPEFGGLFGLLGFLLSIGIYVTVLLLIMGIIDYARRNKDKI
ncbi:hypothetical protein ES703_114564 [subsurface metagenome]